MQLGSPARHDHRSKPHASSSRYSAGTVMGAKPRGELVGGIECQNQMKVTLESEKTGMLKLT